MMFLLSCTLETDTVLLTNVTPMNSIKIIAFLYTKNKISGKEMKIKQFLFAIASKIIKYLGINLTKDLKDLYTENYKALLKDVGEGDWMKEGERISQ